MIRYSYEKTESIWSGENCDFSDVQSGNFSARDLMVIFYDLVDSNWFIIPRSAIGK